MKIVVTVKMIIVGAILLFVIWMFSTCGCTHGGLYGIYEGVTDIASSKEGAGITVKASTPVVSVDTKSGTVKPDSEKANGKSTATASATPAASVTITTDKKGTPSIASTASPAKTEGYTNLMGYNSNNSTVNWGMPAPVSNYVAPSQENPLSRGELNMFANTPFKPECCLTTHSTYTKGNGCACMNKDQYNYLITRGGNNVPFAII
jgi:hypothetical protein